jgi:hypothetical protein
MVVIDEKPRSSSCEIRMPPCPGLTTEKKLRHRKENLLAGYTERNNESGVPAMRSLNRLKWLHAFEATARHGSFTGAAQEALRLPQ